MISFLIAAGLLSGAGSAAAPVEQPRGGYNTFGYYTPPTKRKREEQPEIAAEIVEAATQHVFRKAKPPERIAARLLPKAKPFDEKRVHAALEAARREWMQRDDDDAMALLLILANA